jgi:DNA-binding transcriptional ArsR family regulator
MGLAQTLEAIAEPTRLRILDAVRDEELSVGDLVERVGMHQPGVSRHLKVLRTAGLVDVRRDGQRRHYRARFAPLQELDAWLELHRRAWDQSLDRLEAHLDRAASDSGAKASRPRKDPS